MKEGKRLANSSNPLRTPPGAIFTVVFDDEKLTLELVKRTEIPKDEPISWMTFDVKTRCIITLERRAYADPQPPSMNEKISTVPE